MGIPRVPINTSPLAALESITPVRDSYTFGVWQIKFLDDCQNPLCASSGKNDNEFTVLHPYPIVKLSRPFAIVSDPRYQHIFLHCTLYLPDNTGPLWDYINGTTIVPTQQLEGPDGLQDIYFIFANLVVKTPGRYKLRYTLIEVTKGQVIHYAVAESSVFTIYDQRKALSRPVPTTLQRKLAENPEYRTFFTTSEAQRVFSSHPGIYRANAMVQLEAPVAHIFNGWKVVVFKGKSPVFGNRQGVAHGRYAVILDAGSSGTRAHVYRWADPVVTRPSAKFKNIEKLPEISTSNEWTKKIRPGVSSFAQNPDRLGPDHLKPLLDHVVDIIPSKSISHTPIFLLATAGMRLLSKQEQRHILTSICSYIRENTTLSLPDCSVHVKVIDGKTEGLYGWIATNYLLGGFDEPEKHNHGKNHHTYGFLDMGGASAQLAFAPNATEARKHANDLTLLRLRTMSGQPKEYKIFVTSWLGFGVREARNRYVKSLLQDTAFKGGRQRPDPCLPEKLTTTVDGTVLPASSPVPGKDPYLVGTGKFEECLRRTMPLLAKDVPCEDDPCLLNGVHVPAIDFDVNHFVGISEYWHTTHEIFEMGHKDKAYDFHTYQSRVKEFCSMDWKAITNGISGKKWGKKVNEQKAFDVCFKAAWIINILHDGIGIPRISIENTQSSTMNGTKEVLKHGKAKGFLDPFQAINKIDSTELSWALGKAVLYASSQMPPAEDALPVGFGSNVPGIPDDFQYPASPHVPAALPQPPQSTQTNGTSEHWHDSLFAGDSPRRIPGVFLFILIILIALFFLCGRERRSHIYRKICFSRGRGSPHKRRGLFGKFPFLRRTGTAYERVLEEGAPDFELGGVDSDDSDLSPTGALRPSKSAPNWGSSHHSTLKYALDNSSTQSVGSALEMGAVKNHVDRTGLVIRTESRDRLSPLTLAPTLNGRKSRASSPVRHKSPLLNI
ncbi:Golgi apyrase [Emydomyces testavorans]|uniref:Golgi apyrase n=1 Tax=Emydomyces testavorans TaxID=2070801 RepID=A0AAF0II61_9EURO|nr:Golgi apyrase [Emydomyces testavorans]